MNVTSSGRAVRSEITLEWSGTDPLRLPKAFFDREPKFLPPGRTRVQMDYWHALGRYPEMAELILSGKLKPVCQPHEFVDDVPTCLGCHFTREMAEDERVAANPKKKAPVATAPDHAAPAHVIVAGAFDKPKP